ncbi:uncharacterized protein LOC133521637 [Cydia pomonella]|uniref:uncharacterized protein LOC133521637 n=1 Tax=Cydia pomonella TaxID=82600 RepID=UPI002ADD7344|nr:uncharacterized protein LOC133521637 [Cydia pomonella]
MSPCLKPVLILAMIFTATAFTILGFFIFSPIQRVASETPCPDGRFCPPHWLCCEAGCCAPATSPPRREQEIKEVYRYPWYAQWPVLFLLGTLGGILICCVWCLVFKRSSHRVYMCSLSCCARRPASDHDSAGSVYPPPRYSRCGSFHQAPPPYSEVTSKPDLFPLVITCEEGDGKSGGNYLMVHYFRNYVIRAPGSLSATSTAESLNSSFICNAANEANSVVPPPYSTDFESFTGCGLLRSLSSLTEREPRAPPRSRTVPEPAPRETTAFRENLVTSPVQPLQDPTFDLELELIDCEMYCDGACKPRLGASPPAHRSPARDDNYEHEAYGLRHLFTCPSTELAGACESPPQPTSPTQSRESTLRRPSDERRHRRIDSLKKTPKARKSSLYMPLSVAYPVRTSRVSPGSRVSSRSAPATPCGALVPNLLHFTQRVSATRHGSRSSRCDEENDPLLDAETETRTDHKF